jgi:dTMP kinase
VSRAAAPPIAAPPRGLIAESAAHGLRGSLIVLEGIDGSGRSTHVRLLEDALRYRGRGVTRASIGTSAIAGEPIRKAKRDRSAGPVETTLLYAADLAERIEQQVLPALGAGLVVLADRYAYTPMARAEARGLDRAWLEDVFSFAMRPDAVLFLDVDPGTAIDRRGDANQALSDEAAGGYRQFEERLFGTFEEYVDRYRFTRVSGGGTIRAVEARLERTLMPLLGERPGRG